MKSTANKIGAAGGRAISQVGRIAGLGLGLAGAVSVGGAITEAMQNGSTASRIAIQAKDTGDPRSVSEIKNDVLRTAKQNAISFGTDTSDQLEQLQAFMNKAGDFKAGSKLLEFMNKLGNATGMTAEDLKAMAESTGSLYNSLIAMGKTPDQAESTTKEVMKNTAMQGVKSVFGAEDFAKLIPAISASAATMGGDFAGNYSSLMNLAGMSATLGGNTDGAEAATSAQDLATEIYLKKKQITKMGMNDVVFDKTGKLKSANEFVPGIIEKTGGDPSKIQEILGKRAGKMLMGDAMTYHDAKDKPAALKNLKDKLNRTSGVTMTDQELEARNKDAIDNDPGKRFKSAMDQFNNAISDSLLPVITSQLIPALSDLAPYVARAAEAVAKFAGFAIENPLSGLGLLIGASFGKELAMAGIQKILSTQFGLVGAEIAAFIALIHDQWDKLKAISPEGIWDALTGSKKADAEAKRLANLSPEEAAREKDANDKTKVDAQVEKLKAAKELEAKSAADNAETARINKLAAEQFAKSVANMPGNHSPSDKPVGQR